MSPQVHWAAGVYVVLSSLLPPLGMVVIVVAAMVDVVKRPTAVWPWQVGWVAIVLPPLLAMSVGLALFPPAPDVVRVTWLGMMALPFTAMPTTATLLLLLLAARTLRPGAWRRQGGLVSGAAALALILLPVTSPWGPFHRIGVFWLPYVPFTLLGTLGIAWVAVVRGSGDDRMRHARRLTGGWFLACSVWILLAGLALTTLRAQNEGSQHIVGPLALTTLGVALGIVVVLGVERRPSLLPVLVALTPLAMVLPAASILGRWARFVEPYEILDVERIDDLILPDTQPTCAKVGADPVFVGPDCLESPVTVRVLPPDAPAHLLHDGDALVVRWHGLPLLLPIEEAPAGAHVAWMEGDGDQPEGWGCGNAGILPSFEVCLEATKGWRKPRDGLTLGARHLTVRQLVDFCTLVSKPCRIVRPVSSPDPRR